MFIIIDGVVTVIDDVVTVIDDVVTVIDNQPHVWNYIKPYPYNTTQDQNHFQTQTGILVMDISMAFDE